MQWARGFEECAKGAHQQASSDVDCERAPRELSAEATADERRDVKPRGATDTAAEGNQQVGLEGKMAQWIRLRVLWLRSRGTR